MSAMSAMSAQRYYPNTLQPASLDSKTLGFLEDSILAGIQLIESNTPPAGSDSHENLYTGHSGASCFTRYCRGEISKLHKGSPGPTPAYGTSFHTSTRRSSSKSSFESTNRGSTVMSIPSMPESSRPSARQQVQHFWASIGNTSCSMKMKGSGRKR